MKELFPDQFADVTPVEFYQAVNIAEPSLIRTEADELTYSLHVMVRYEIEKGLINKEIAVKDLPQIWKAKMKEYLGVDVPNDTKGVLQDIHWGSGYFGYFPTYALGSAYGAQMLKRMKKDLDIELCCEKGDLAPIVSWLEDKVFRYGCMMDPIPLFEQYCGEKFSAEPYCQYLKEKYSDIYGL
jgi:carboxypeptidase Taq